MWPNNATAQVEMWPNKVSRGRNYVDLIQYAKLAQKFFSGLGRTKKEPLGHHKFKNAVFLTLSLFKV